jgi:hypothetical protein
MWEIYNEGLPFSMKCEQASFLTSGILPEAKIG